jgi:hypothetical protein
MAEQDAVASATCENCVTVHGAAWKSLAREGACSLPKVVAANKAEPRNGSMTHVSPLFFFFLQMIPENKALLQALGRLTYKHHRETLCE